MLEFHRLGTANFGCGGAIGMTRGFGRSLDLLCYWFMDRRGGGIFSARRCHLGFVYHSGWQTRRISLILSVMVVKTLVKSQGSDVDMERIHR
jgi:hypothetical protein